MGLKIIKEREMLSPKRLEAIVGLATVGNDTVFARQRGYNYQTLKNTISAIYDKVEKHSGTRPAQANVALYFIFGRFLGSIEIRHLIESGELHGWKMNLSEEE